MLEYPRFDFDSTSYGEQPLAGSSTVLAEDGTPTIVRTHTRTWWRLTLLHKGMSVEQQDLLQAFYEGAYAGYVRLWHERYQKFWRVLMEGPPELVEMSSPAHADMQMIVIGRPEQ